MTANQTIDGVPRELLERLVRFAGGKAKQELCALLDAPAVDSDPIVGVLKNCLSEGVQPTFSGGDLKHLIRLLESKTAAQPQGEPVAWLVGFEIYWTLEDAKGSVRNPDITPKPLYAEQHAPVAPTIRINADGSITPKPSSYVDVPIKPAAWSVRHVSGKYGFVTLDRDEAVKWASVRNDVSIHALGPIDQAAPVSIHAHDGGNNQKGDGPTVTEGVAHGYYSSGDGGGSVFEKWQTAAPLNYGLLDPVQRLAVCRGEQVAVVLPNRDRITLSAPLKIPAGYVLDGHCEYELQIWRACIDEVTRLNNK